MGMPRRSWWQKFKRHPFIATGVIVALTALILCGLVVYFGWDWTGVSSSQTKTITTEVIQSPQKKVTTTQTTQPGKTLWDWLQLLGVLAIPIVVGFGTAFFTRQQAKTSEANAENQQQEELLRTYFDKMSELVLNSELSTNLNVQSIVRARTLAALHILNATRKGIVFRFLHDSNLLQHVKSYFYLLDLSNTDLIRIDLHEADLYKADLRNADLREVALCATDLRGANLERADLRGANLERAKLHKADLRDADLRDADLRVTYLIRADLHRAKLEGAKLEGADLSEADLSGATVTTEQLEKARLLQGAIMPDGKIHP